MGFVGCPARAAATYVCTTGRVSPSHDASEHTTAITISFRIDQWYQAAMDRTLYREEHEMFRRSFRQFVERDVVPNQERWREAGSVDRETWSKAGQNGFLCPWLPEADGGPGGDFLH